MSNRVVEIINGYAIYNFKKDNEFVSLKDFNFSFEEGKIYCIIGESGSGKSTLVSLFNGLNRLEYGDIRIHDIVLQSKKDLSKVLLAIFKKGKDYILKCSKDVKNKDVECFLKATFDNKKITFKKLSSGELKKRKITNTKNKFYVIDNINDELKKFLTNNFEEFNQEDLTLITRKGIKKNKRIKNYKEFRRQIGMVSQFPEFQLFKSTVIDDVSFGPKVLGMDKKEAIENAKKELKKLRIPETHFDNSPFALSGGQKRRVAISGILSINPKTLIFDEPTAGLDPIGEQEILDIIKDAKKHKKTCFVITHSMNHVLELADEVIVIHDGRLVASGDAYEIFNNKNVLKNTNIELPYVIEIVNKLISENKKFEKLNEYKPRTIEELALYIAKIKKQKRK